MFIELCGWKGLMERGLGHRELQCVLAVASGKNTKEIARELECAPGTVKKTVERIFFKFGVSSRTALVAEAFKRGLISFASAASPSPENHNSEESHQGVFIA